MRRRGTARKRTSRAQRSIPDSSVMRFCEALLNATASQAHSTLLYAPLEEALKLKAASLTRLRGWGHQCRLRRLSLYLWKRGDIWR